MTPRFIIANIQQFMNMAGKNETIMSVPGFSTLRTAFEEFRKPVAGCKCTKGAKLNNYRTQFETAISNLSDGDKAMLKEILKATTICYYVKSTTGGLTLSCF